RGLAKERVSERQLALPTEPAGGALDDHLPLDERAEPRIGAVGATVSAEQRRDAAGPERVAEDARRAEHAARRGVEALEPRLRHRHDRPGELAPEAGRLGADELLEVERVAAGEVAELVRRLLAHRIAERGLHEPDARLARQLAQPELLHPAIRPQRTQPLF